jgi:hypothetical protein
MSVAGTKTTFADRRTKVTVEKLKGLLADRQE